MGVPTEKFQKGEFSLTGNPTQAVSSLTWNDDQVITARVEMPNKDQVIASLEAPSMEKMSVDMTHKFTPTTFVNKVTFQWAPTKKVSTNIDISMQ